jgi:hypothetical protein
MFRTVFSAILSFAILLGAGDYSSVAKPRTWPLIEPLSWSGEMELLGPPTLISIQSPEGTILYRLYCSSLLAPPEPEWLTGGDNYGGDFECLLTDAKPGTPAKRATLLNYDPEDLSQYHSNLGTFVWTELLGINCWNNPEWGADRTFYLRGMRLRIHVVGIKVELYKDKKQGQTYPIIRRVTVEISAQPDQSAYTELARPPSQRAPTACIE